MKTNLKNIFKSAVNKVLNSFKSIKVTTLNQNEVVGVNYLKGIYGENLIIEAINKHNVNNTVVIIYNSGLAINVKDCRVEVLN